MYVDQIQIYICISGVLRFLWVIKRAREAGGRPGPDEHLPGPHLVPPVPLLQETQGISGGPHSD